MIGGRLHGPVDRMSQNHENLRRVLQLAKTPSSEKRRELLREVTDLFLADDEAYSDVEREHFGAIMGRIAKDMEMAVRADLAQTLGSLPTAPHALIQQLAHDEFPVAHEVISKSPVLEDADLVEIANSKGQEYLEAIAVRPTVSQVVSEALVDRGNDNVLVKLVSNVGAILSRNAIEKVVERSEGNEALQTPLIARQDLPVDLLNEMFSFVSSNLRTQIIQKMDGLPQDMLDNALSHTRDRFSKEVRQIKEADRRARVFVSEAARKRELNESLLVQLMRSGQTVEFTHAFARLGDIDVKTAQRIVQTRNTEGIAIVCRSARFDRATFSALALLIDASPTRSSEATQELLGLYDQVTPEAAQRVMRFWKVRRDATAQISAGAEAAAAAH
ncbi:MAG: DUF2336 domain-containing protein [Alphaproteobacteria bacterium]|nr:DUF2336 domain-containing protein [Alphaproteobacteria bacterium]